MAMTDKKCFIIMPISTPPELISDYKDYNDHFLRVMEYLFIPAIKEAGFEPIKPITKGSDIIHGLIISNLESSDLVLCDMSTKNPNVFFELGIRTALNKPVCLVKDPFLKKVPFDTALINYHEYLPDFCKWVLDDQVQRLAKHIKDSFSESDNCNSLWKYFGTKTQSKEVIAQSKKEQQIRDIEKNLELFYMPAQHIMNVVEEFLKDPIHFTKWTEEVYSYQRGYHTQDTTPEEFASAYAVEKLKEIKQYLFLSKESTYQSFMKYVYGEENEENRLELSIYIQQDIKGYLSKLHELKQEE